MRNGENFRLCGGTFFSLLLQANENCSASQDVRFRDFLGVIDPQVLSEVSKGEAFDKLHTYASKFRNCKQVPTNGKYIKLGNNKVCAVFLDELKRDANAPIRRVQQFADEYIPVNSRMWLIRCILELIEADEEIKDNEKFFAKPGFAPVYKADFLREDSEIDFYDFLLGIWFYVYKNCGDNTVGEMTIQSWYQKGKPNVEGVFDAATIGSSEKYQNIVLRENLRDFEPVEDEASFVKAKTMNACGMESRLMAYMKAAYKKYSNKRTFIYDTERPFTEFYVCNDVERASHNRVMAYMDGLRGIHQTKEIYHDISVSDFLTNKSCLVGQGGAGKSMMLNHLFLDAVNNYSSEKIVPVLTTLSDYEPDRKDLMYLISRSISRFDRKIDLSDILDQLDNKSTVVLLDGLDEVKKEYVQDCKKEIEFFADQFPNCRLIVSSRDIPELRAIDGFYSYFIRSLREEQAFEMVRKLDPIYVDEDVKERFINDVKEERFRFNEKEKRDFFGNPLFLSIMIVSYSQNNNIPTQRYLFYEQAYRAMATRHDGIKGITRNFFTGLNERQFLKYLGQFCADSYADYNLKFSQNLIEKYLEKTIRENGLKTTPEMFLKDMTEKLCLLYLDGNEYRFIHRSFQEYFAAYYFTTLMDDEYKDVYDALKVLDRIITSDETISMLCGLDQNRFERYIVIPLLEEIVSRDDEAECYKRFIKRYYSKIEYATGNLDGDVLDNDVESALYQFVTSFYGIKVPTYKVELDESWADQTQKCYIIDDQRFQTNGGTELVNELGMYRYYKGNGELYDGVEIVEEGYFCKLNLLRELSNSSWNEDLWQIIYDDGFLLKREFNAAKKLLERLQDKYAVVEIKKRRFGLGMVVGEVG